MPWHTKTMAGDDSAPRSQASLHLQPINPKNQDKCRFLSHELCHYHIFHSLHKPSMAPHLIDRLHRHNGGMVVSIFST